jgi:hypothetical protein
MNSYGNKGDVYAFIFLATFLTPAGVVPVASASRVRRPSRETEK